MMTKIDDPTLSWKAKGILAYLEAHPHASMGELVSASTDGRDAVRRGLTELAERGLIAPLPRRRRRLSAENPLTSAENPLTSAENPLKAENPLIKAENPHLSGSSSSSSNIIRTNNYNYTPLSAENPLTSAENPLKAENPHLAAVAEAIMANGFGALSPLLAEELAEMVNEFGATAIIRALAVAVQNNKRNLRYVRGILTNWRRGHGAHPQQPTTSPGVAAFTVAEWEKFNSSDPF